MARFQSWLWRTLKTLVTALVVFAVILGGAVAFGVVEKPTVVGVENQFSDVNASTTLVATQIALSNPNPVGVHLGDATVTHTVAMNGIEMGSGTNHGIDLPSGRSSVPITTRIENDNIPAWWASHVKNGEKTRVTTTARFETPIPFVGPVELSRNRSFETDLLSRFDSTKSRKISAGVPLVPDPLLVVTNTSATWGAVKDNRTAIDMAIHTKNPNHLPIPITRLAYNVSMNGITVANGTTDSKTLAANARTTVHTTAHLRNNRLDDWWVSHLKRDQTTTLKVAFTAVIELPNGETVRLPLDALGYTRRLSTDVFGTNEE